MLRLIGIVISIGLADSLNPTTIGPGLVMAAGDKPRRDTIRFTIGAFLANVAGGLIIALGPGHLLLSLIPHPGDSFRQTVEMIAGGALLAGGVILWRYRRKLSQKNMPDVKPGDHGALILGASITAIELPTAFPYFGALAAIVGANLNPEGTALLILLYNVCFLLPLVGVIVALYVYGNRAEAKLERGWNYLQDHWPVILSIAAGLAGLITFILGATGFVRHSHTKLGRFLRHLLHVHLAKH